MKILRAEHLGMCFGVRDAINLALAEAERRPLTVLGELVHNETVLSALRERGVRIARTAEEVETSAAMVTAHGASETAMRRALGRGLELKQATCPLVHFAHRAVARLVSEGYHPVIVGKRDHVEVRGITEDLREFDVILTEAEVAALPERSRFGVAAQTTQPMEKVQALLAALRARFPRSEVRFADTICRPTKERQTAAVELARQCDVVVVIGGLQSNNTRELAATCARYCSRVHHVQTAVDLRPEWFAAAQTAGFTAGTSTPDSVIEEVHRRMLEFAAVGHEGPGEQSGQLRELRAA